MIKLHDCNLKLSDEVKRELVVMLERLKLDVQEGLIVGVQAVCVRGDGLDHAVWGGMMLPVMNEIHSQFTLENRRITLKTQQYLKLGTEVKS